jgi:hypothetical protein
MWSGLARSLRASPSGPSLDLTFNPSREMTYLPLRDPRCLQPLRTGWMIAYRDGAELAKRPIEESCKK